jgi:hypothetical protein
MAWNGGWVDVATTFPPPEKAFGSGSEGVASKNSTIVTFAGSAATAFRETVAGAVKVWPAEGSVIVTGNAGLPDPPVDVLLDPFPPPPQAGSRAANAAPRIRIRLVFMAAGFLSSVLLG